MASDFLYDENYDLLIEDGDLVAGFSDDDHIDDNIQFCEGELKQFPLCGVGIDNYNQAPNVVQNLKRVINSKLEADNATVKYLSIKFDGQGKAIIDINAVY